MAEEEDWDLTVLWRIDDYASLHYYGVNEELRTPSFTVEALDHSRWNLIVFPGGWNEKNDENGEYIFQCYLFNRMELDDPSEIDWDIICKFQISTASGKVLLTHETSYVFTNGHVLGMPHTIKCDELHEELLRCYNRTSSDALLFKCFIKRNDESEKLSLKKELRTRVASHKCSFNWKVKFLSHSKTVMGKKNFCLADQFFQISIAIQSENVFITLRKLKRNSFIRRVRGKIALLNVYGYVVIECLDCCSFFEKDTWEFGTFMTKTKLTDNVSEYVKDGNISLHCEFFLNSSIYVLEEPKTVSKSKCHTLDSMISLRSDFCRLLDDKTNFDLKIFEESNVELKAHKSVLAARSPVFCAMFDQKMLENRTGKVKIVDVDSKTLESFLKFLYTGVSEIMDSERALNLLMLADMYQVTSLKEVCASFLMSMSSLSVDSVCNILQIADMIHHEQLKTACSDYVAHHVA